MWYALNTVGLMLFGDFIFAFGLKNCLTTLYPVGYSMDLDSDFNVWLRDMMFCLWAWVAFMGLVLVVFAFVLEHKMHKVFTVVDGKEMSFLSCLKKALFS